ncbi:hypothetical protein B0T13DRAFT_471196 [Neurospora crassa]|nr:hypothetical protein B0T13DRAFT_471196 [Neurospora crassa]
MPTIHYVSSIDRATCRTCVDQTNTHSTANMNPNQLFGEHLTYLRPSAHHSWLPQARHPQQGRSPRG